MSEIVNAEFSAPAVVDQPLAPPTIFNTSDPEAYIEHATKLATALVKVVTAKGLSKRLNKKKPDEEFLELEAWQLLGGMTKVYAVIEWTKEREDGWEARAVAYTIDGQMVGAGEAVCLTSEYNWRGKDSYALKGMAQTRAMSRALRAPLGFIVTLAGYKATAAEEISDTSGFDNRGGSVPEPSPSGTRSPEAPAGAANVPPAADGAARVADAIARQRRAMFARAREFGVDTEKLREYIRATYAVESSNELTTTQRAEVIARMPDIGAFLDDPAALVASLAAPVARGSVSDELQARAKANKDEALRREREILTHPLLQPEGDDYPL